MYITSVLLALVAAGVNFGWRPAEGEADGYEYIVQIEPELLEVLQRGEKVPIESNVPPHVAPIRMVSIVVGRGEVPRDPRDVVERTAFFAESDSDATAGRYDRPPPSAGAETWVGGRGTEAASQPVVSDEQPQSLPEAADLEGFPPLEAVRPIPSERPASQPPRIEPPALEEPSAVESQSQPALGPFSLPADFQLSFDHSASPIAAEPPSLLDTTPPIGVAGSPAEPLDAPSNVIQLGAIDAEPRPQSLANADEPVPWFPLLALGVALAGSLGANLFLGWSYFDARRRYSNLARDTAEGARNMPDAA